MSSTHSYNVYVLFDFWIPPFCVKIPTRRIRHVFHSQNPLYSNSLVNHKYLLSNLRTERVRCRLAVLFANCTLIINGCVVVVQQKRFTRIFLSFFITDSFRPTYPRTEKSLSSLPIYFWTELFVILFTSPISRQM